MQTGYVIDEKGFLLYELTATFEEPLPNVVFAPPGPELTKPLWNGKVWTEGASAEVAKDSLSRTRQECKRRLAAEVEHAREALAPAGPHALAVEEQRLREARYLLQGIGLEEVFLLPAEAKSLGQDTKDHASRVLESHKAWANTQAQLQVILVSTGAQLDRDQSWEALTAHTQAAVEAVWVLVARLSGPTEEPYQTGGVKPPPVPPQPAPTPKEPAEVKPTPTPVAAEAAQVSEPAQITEPAADAKLTSAKKEPPPADLAATRAASPPPPETLVEAPTKATTKTSRTSPKK